VAVFTFLAFFAPATRIFGVLAITISRAGELSGFVGFTPFAIFPILAVLTTAIAIRATGVVGITPRLYVIRIVFGRGMLAMSTFSGLS
jgi:hypothetical protein